MTRSISRNATKEDRVVLARKPRKLWPWLLALLLVVLLAALAYWLTTEKKPANLTTTPQAVISVSLTPAQFRGFTQHVDLTGSVAAIDPLTIGAEATGLKIVNVPVEEGMFVGKGALLAQLDSSVLNAQLAAAQARLQGAKAAATKSIQPNRPQEIAALQQAYNQANSDISNRNALVQQARANYETALHQARRYQTLVSQGAVSQAEAEAQLTTAKTALAQVTASQAQVKAAQQAANQARERLNMAQAGGRTEDIAMAQATTAENAAAVQQLRAQIAQTRITAPDSGLIIKRDAHLGDISSPTKSLFQMVRKGQLELRAQVSQQDLTKIHVGSGAKIVNEHGTTKGNVWAISPSLDTATRLATVRIMIPLASGLMPGMFARAQVAAGTVNSISLPDSAAIYDGMNQYVFVYDGGIARKRSVKIGDRSGTTIQVLSGLSAGEMVIVSGGGFLHDGDRVRAVGR